MKNLQLLTSIVGVVPALVAAAPVSEPRGSPLETRGAQTCKIVNVDSYVNCRWYPDLSEDDTGIIVLPGGSEYIFECYEPGDCYNGYCTWDRVTLSDYKITCYVNGYFTDDNCSSSILPKCSSV